MALHEDSEPLRWAAFDPNACYHACVTESDLEFSRFLSYVLRHRPDAAGVALDAQGWVAIEDLLIGCNSSGKSLTRADLSRIVETSPKRRFAVSADGSRIRASQGHSIPVDLGLTPDNPPDVLYHGTATRFLSSILASGLQPRERTKVHLSLDRASAIEVGRRHGCPALLIVDAHGMAAAGHVFLRAENGIWLTDHVPSAFLTLASSSDADSATTSKQPNPSR